jgi:hypothetical protein
MYKTCIYIHVYVCINIHMYMFIAKAACALADTQYERALFLYKQSKIILK